MILEPDLTIGDLTSGSISEKDTDGSRYLWFYFKKNGYYYDYVPTLQLRTGNFFVPITDKNPQLGDIAWWDKFVGVYDPHIPQSDTDASTRINLRTARGERRLSQLEREYGTVTWLRHKNSMLMGGSVTDVESKGSFFSKFKNSFGK